MSKVPAYVLPQEAATTSEPQVFGDAFPGRYTPGVPVPVSEVGLTEDEAAERVDALGLPLELVMVDPPADPVEAKPPRTHEEANKQAAALGITVEGTVAEKAAAIAAAREAATQGDGEGTTLDEPEGEGE